MTGRQYTVLDPSFGGGIFLRAAAERILALGGNPGEQVLGIEIDECTFQQFVSREADQACSPRIHRADFFSVSPVDFPRVDAVVGNPPYIRYHRFSGESRRIALQRAHDVGVKLSQLTSSWAPFLVHAVQFVKDGGRLGMVVPAELMHAAYARPVLSYLAYSFREVRIFTFSRRLFSALSEDTVLIVASGKGRTPNRVSVISLRDSLDLDEFLGPDSNLPAGTGIDHDVVNGRAQGRVVHYLLPERTRDLYRQLRSLANVAQLAELADVGIGYVSGDNTFFHVDAKTATAYGIPAPFLRRVARRGADLSGLSFTCADWQNLHDLGHANLLLYVRENTTLPDSVRAYLDEGARSGVPSRYKCRMRKNWYCVPHVYQPDAFLTYMSGPAAKLVANAADATSPNTLLLVRLSLLGSRRCVDALHLALSWQTSLTAISCELEGHSLGGGLLKLEPSEAGRVVVALPERGLSEYGALAEEIDRLIRSGRSDLARERGDAVILREWLGLSDADIRLLRDGWLALKTRRLRR